MENGRIYVGEMSKVQQVIEEMINDGYTKEEALEEIRDEIIGYMPKSAQSLREAEGLTDEEIIEVLLDEGVLI